MIDEALWTELEAAYPDHTGTVRRRVHSNNGFDIYAAVAQPSSERLVVLVVQAGLLLPVLADTGSLAISWLDAEDGRVELRVRLVEREMKPVFTPFADDVLGAMAAATTGQAALDSLADRFDHWRNLLSGRPEGLGLSSLMGLFGELWALANLCAPTAGTSESVRAWDGPDRTRRDIVFGGLGIEVKTTLAVPPASVTISSELQLDESPLDRLVLVALELDQSSGANGQTVPDLVDYLSDGLDLVNELDELRVRLEQCGYHEMHLNRYQRQRFLIRRLGIYAVDPGFPRIVPADLHPGIGEVRYRLSLGACEPWAITAEHLSIDIAEAIGGLR